jgi:tripartite-type tricarboxylate transporter receptor subunit TctC
LTDLISVQISFSIVYTIVSIPQISGSKVRAIAVTSPKRKPILPKVPAVSESTNLSVFEYMGIFAVFGPPGLPMSMSMSILCSRQTSVQKSGEDAGLRAQFGAIGLELQTGTSEQLLERFQHESQRWTLAAAGAGIEPK